MKEIGIVVCNFNKREYVINCIQSILDSTVDNYDLHVVDNASTDDSVAEIQKKYKGKLELIVNQENLGGSGGFNTGLRKALESNENYKYLMCVDNDILMDKDNIQKLYEFLEVHQEVGMVGSKICRMQHPERLQELGADIDFENYTVTPHFKDYLDNEEIPQIQYCDYVPACSLMIRRDVVEKIGLMPEENFIYWDDMEWGYKVNQAGYKVAAYSKAKVLHAMGTKTGDYYFSAYYFWRNRIHFFAKYTPEEKRENMMNTLLEIIFQVLYGCYYKGKNNQIKTLTYAWDDAVHEKMGKADEGKILKKNIIEDRLANLIKDKNEVIIYFDENYKHLQDLIVKATGANAEIKITVICENIDQMNIQHPECKVLKAGSKETKITDDTHILKLQMCNHVSQIKDRTLRIIYVDEYTNILENQKDLMHFENYDYNRDFFIRSQKALFERFPT